MGGGWSAEHHRSVYGAFVRESVTTATDPSSTARVGVLQLFDRSVEDGEAKFGQFADILTRLGPCRAVPFLVAEGESVPPGVIGDVDGLLVAGGLTPAYQAALAPVAEEIRELVARGVPYLGFSAGAAVAATTAVIGGWRDGEVAIAPEDCAEDLDQVTSLPGLGLVDFAVDVHAAQWGTLTRVITAVSRGDIDRAVAIDESTVCIVDDTSVTIAGAGHAWWVTRARAGVTVRAARDTTIARSALHA